MAKIYNESVGLQIIVDCGENIIGATGTYLKVRLPDGNEVEWPATIDNPDSLTYMTVNGDLSQYGEYFVQAFLTLGGWTGRGETDNFIVHNKFG